MPDPLAAGVNHILAALKAAEEERDDYKAELEAITDWQYGYATTLGNCECPTHADKVLKKYKEKEQCLTRK